jgi:hypothetical protein
MPLQIRRGLAAERSTLSSPLAIGELLYVTDQGKLYIGDGTVLTDPADTLGNVGQGGKGLIITGFTSIEAKTAASEVFTGGTHTGINFVYDSLTQTIDATVDLSNYDGVLKATSFKGSVVADDSSLLVDAVDGKIFGIIEASQLRSSESEVKLGFQSTGTNQGTYGISVGHNAGDQNQGTSAIAIGFSAGSVGQGTGAIAIGSDASNTSQGNNSIAIGVLAGGSSQGANSIAIGREAGNGGTFAGSIILNATGSALASSNAGLYIDPIRNIVSSTGTVLQYNATTKEISYTSDITGNFKGSIFNDDSTLMYDAISKALAAQVISAASSVSIGDVILSFDPLDAGVMLIGDVSTPTTVKIDADQNISMQIEGTSPSSFTGGGSINFRIRGGTLASPTAVASEFVTGGLQMSGYTGTGFSPSAQLLSYVEPGATINPGDSFIPSEIVIAPASASALDGSTGMVITNKGIVAANSFACNSFANPTARDALITSPFPGQIVYLDDDGLGQPRFQGYKGAPVNAWVTLV